MGWSIGFDTNWQRDIGYGVPAYCDHPGCYAVIDRGLSYVCGGEPYGGDHGCGLYFCGHHLWIKRVDVYVYDQQRGQHFTPGKQSATLCWRCISELEPFDPTPDHEDWLRWKLTHESWAQWRSEEVQHIELEP